jgi:hypothetical protein
MVLSMAVGSDGALCVSSGLLTEVLVRCQRVFGRGVVRFVDLVEPGAAPLAVGFARGPVFTTYKRGGFC